MSLDIEKVAERLRVKIQKTIPKNVDGTPTEAFKTAFKWDPSHEYAFDEYKEIAEDLRWQFYVWNAFTESCKAESIQDDIFYQSEEINQLRIKLDGADEDEQWSINNAIDHYYENAREEFDDTINALGFTLSLITNYIREHDVQESEPAWNANETLQQCIRLAWAIFNAQTPRDLNLFWGQINDIFSVCTNVLPALEQNAQLSNLRDDIKSIKNDTSIISTFLHEIKAFVERIWGKVSPSREYSPKDIFLFTTCRRIRMTGTLRGEKYYGPFYDLDNEGRVKAELSKDEAMYKYVIGNLEKLSNGQFRWLSKNDTLTWRSLKTNYLAWERGQK